MGFKMQGWSAFTKNGDTKKEAERTAEKTAKITEFDKADATVAEPDWSEFSDSKPLTDKEKKAERLKEIKLTRKRLANSGKNKSPMKKRTYSEAKAKDSELDQYIKDRKKYKAGSTEYENLQAKINAAYGTKRSEKMKASQIKRHKDDASRTGDQKKKKDTGGYIPQTVSRKDISTDYDPASRNKRKEYIPISQRK